MLSLLPRERVPGIYCFLILLFWSPDIFLGVLVRFIDLTHFIFPSDSDELLPITIHAWRSKSNRQDRTGPLGQCWYTRAKYKICEFFVLRKLARWPLTCLLYMLCPNIDTCQWRINSLPFSCTYCTSYVHPVRPWQSPNSSNKEVRERYIPAILLSNFPRAASTDPYNTNTCMSHQISESFLLFSFSRVHDCIHYPCKGAAVSQCQPNLASCHNVKFWFLIKRTRDLSWSPFLSCFLFCFLSSSKVGVVSITCSSDDINNNKVMSPPIYLEPYSETTGT